MNKKTVTCILLAIASVLLTPLTHKTAYASDDDYSASTFTTPYGASVPIAYLQSEDADEDYPSLTDHPSAICIENGSKRYNCFTYAMIFGGNVKKISQHTNDELFTIEDPSRLIIGNPCLTGIDFEEISPNDLVMYKILPSQTEFFPNAYIHAGLIYEKGDTLESTVVISKWGKHPIYRHNLTDNPYMGTSYQLQATKPPYDRIIGFSFYRVNHNFIHTVKYVNSSSLAIRPTSNCHKSVCSDCGAFHYEAHTYVNINNYIACRDCGYNTGKMINGIVPETK